MPGDDPSKTAPVVFPEEPHTAREPTVKLPPDEEPTDRRDRYVEGPATTEDGLLSATLPSPPRPRIPIAALDVTPETPGRYRLSSVIARGGQSLVSIAYDTHLGREVAFKQPLGQDTALQQPGARFLREARITATLEHPNIVPIYEIGRRADGSLYCTQKLILPPRGEKRPKHLGRALSEAVGLPARLRLLRHLVEACSGVAFAHGHGVVHRDLKPENILIGAFGETVVVDWGLARVRGDADEVKHRNVGESVEQSVIGTPAYMSPEQARGDLRAVDERSDVWGLGAILYQILTGRPPFGASTPFLTVKQVLTAPLVPVLRLEPAAPRELIAVAEKALSKDPKDRYPSAKALAEELEAYLAGTRVGVYRYSNFELIKLMVSRHRALSLVIALAGVLLSAAAVSNWLSYLRGQRYLAEARESLAVTLIDRAHDAERSLQWDRSAIYYALARTEDDRPEARLGAQLADERARLSIDFLAGNGDSVSALGYSHRGALLAVGTVDGRVRVYDTAKNALLFELRAHDGSTATLAFSPDDALLATGSSDKTAKLFTLKDRAGATVLEAKDGVTSVCFSPDGQRLLVSSEDRVTYLLDVRTHALERTLEGHSMAVYASDISPDGSLAVTGSRDDTVLLWNLREPMEPPRALVGHSEAVLAAKFSPDGQLLATAGRDNSIRLWSLPGLQLLHLLAGHERKVLSLAFSPDGKRLASGSADRTVRLWDTESGQPLLDDSYGLEIGVTSVAWSPDGKTLAFAGGNDLVGLHHLPARAAAGSTLDVMLPIAVSPDGRLVAHSEREDLVVRDAVSLAEKHRFVQVSDPVLAASFTRDGLQLVAGCSHTDVCFFDLATFTLQRRVKSADSANVEALAISYDGTLLAVAGRDGVVRLYDLKSGLPLGELRGPADTLFSISLSADGRWAAGASYDKNVYVWDVQTRELKATLEGHGHGVRRVAFSPDGLHLASASYDHTVRQWSVPSFAEEATLRGHEDHVLGLTWMPDSSAVVSAARDGTVRLWDATTHQERGRYLADEQWVHAVAVAPDGRALFYGGRRLHRVELPSLPPPRQWLDEKLAQTHFRLVGTEPVRVRP